MNPLVISYKERIGHLFRNSVYAGYAPCGVVLAQQLSKSNLKIWVKSRYLIETSKEKWSSLKYWHT